MRNWKGITTSFSDTWKIVGGYYEPYNNKLENLNEIDKYVEKYNYYNWHISHNSPVTMKAIKSII